MNLVLHTLRVLREAGENLTPEDTLRVDLRSMISPPPLGAEVSAALHQIETRRLGVAVRDELTGAVRWKITDSGRAALAERGI